MINETSAMTDGTRKRAHLCSRLCGEKQRPDEEEQSAGQNFMIIPGQTTAVEMTS